jgi:phosphate starvation-inducible membrane PsiE
MIVLQGALLFVMGQPMICPCGHVALWTGVINGPENSQQLSDWYTLSHIVNGVLFFWILSLITKYTRFKFTLSQRFLIALGVEIGWELFENSDFIINRYRSATIAFDYYGDSIVNSISDSIAMSVGFLLAKKIRTSLIVAAIIFMELLAAFMVRDNLTLNIVMLLYPIEAVQVWQSSQ